MFPLALIAATAIALGIGVHQASKRNDRYQQQRDNAQDRINRNRKLYDKKIRGFKSIQKKVTLHLTDVGRLRQRTISSFVAFANLFEQIKSRPEFEKFENGDETLPAFNCSACVDFSNSANSFFASCKKGAIDLLPITFSIFGPVGSIIGFIVSDTFKKTSTDEFVSKAGKISRKIRSSIKKMDKYEGILLELDELATEYETSLRYLNKLYNSHFKQLKTIVYEKNKTNWNRFTENEKLLLENTVLLVQLRFMMSKVQLAKQSTKSKNSIEPNKIATRRIVNKANRCVENIAA